MKQWADGMALKAGLARYQGSVSFYGSAKVIPGCLIELKGLGKRFGGNMFVGSVTHTIENNEWITEAGAGVSPNITDEPDVVSPTALGFLPGLQGLHTAVVKKLDGDPQKEYRIQVELPWLNGKSKVLWALDSVCLVRGLSGCLICLVTWMKKKSISEIRHRKYAPCSCCNILPGERKWNEGD